MTTMLKKQLELAKQRFNVTLADQDAEFKPTSNGRNTAMLQECSKFSQVLKAVHKDLSQVDKSVTAGLDTVRRVLEAPLPRAYDDGAGGGAYPAERDLTPIGAGVQTEVFTASAEEGNSRLHSEVLEPLAAWLSAYKAIKERNVKVEEVRLALDVKRRLFENTKTKYLKMVAKAKNEIEQDEVYHQAQTEEDKMNRLIQRYVEMEEEVYQAALALVNDTAHLRDYLFASLAILKGSFAGAMFSFTDAYPGLEVGDVPLVVRENSRRTSRVSNGSNGGHAVFCAVRLWLWHPGQRPVGCGAPPAPLAGQDRLCAHYGGGPARGHHWQRRPAQRRPQRWWGGRVQRDEGAGGVSGDRRAVAGQPGVRLPAWPGAMRCVGRARLCRDRMTAGRGFGGG